MRFIDDILTKLTIGKINKPKITKKTVINELMEEPEKFKAELYMESDEIIFKIKKKEAE